MKKVVSKINTIITTEYLKTQKENQYFERKGIGEKNLKPVKIANELIGMLNADGGILVFGMTDTGNFQDLRTLGKRLDAYRKLIFDFIIPPCNIQLEEILIDNNLIFIYHVEQELERIFCRKDNDEVYLRVYDETRKLDREQTKKLEYDRAIRQFEEETEAGFLLEDLDKDLLEQYRKKLNYKGSGLELLEKRHLVLKKNKKYIFKKAAILLFSKNPEKYIPSASVRYIRYEGKEALVGAKHNVTKDERFENNVPKLIDELRIFLRASMKEFYFLDLKTGTFKNVKEYPEEAWLEGIVNALCHRSYNIQGNAIYIKHFDDRLEISNSGPLPAQVTVENIRTERFSRNPRLARVLEDLGYVRQLNEGVSRIYESMEESMLSVPEYKVINKNVFLTLRNRIADHAKTIDNEVMNKIERNFKTYNETQQKILSYLFKNQQATLGELSDFTKINGNTIRTYLNGFIDDHIIEKKSEKQRDINALYVFKKP